jgi:hypothetical protein
VFEEAVGVRRAHRRRQRRVHGFDERFAGSGLGLPQDPLRTPAGMEGLIRETGEPTRTLDIPLPPEEPPDEAEMGRLMAIAAKYGGEMLGPPPGR